MPLEALIANKELQHIEFKAGKCMPPVRADSDFGDFRRYALRGDRCCSSSSVGDKHGQGERVEYERVDYIS